MSLSVVAQIVRSSAPGRGLGVAAIASLLLGVVAAPGYAERPTTAPASAAMPLVSEPLVNVQWSGDLRVRGESLGGVRQNNDNAQLPTHLDVRHGAAEKGSAAAMQGADLRLRLEPSLHVGDWSQINLQLDAWGQAGGSALLSSFADHGGDANWTSGSNSAGFALRRGWIHSHVLGLLDVDVGRMPDHFGMGMLRNQGDSLLGDWQSSIDRVRIAVELFGLRAAISRGNLFSWPSGQGANGATMYNTYAGGGGPLWLSSTSQAGLPVQDSTDVIRYDFEVSGGRLHGDKGLAWSIALLWQSQDFAYRFENLQNPGSGSPAPADQLAKVDCGNDCILLSQRTFRSYTFQAASDWKGTWRGAPLRAEAEGAFIYGTLGRTDITVDPDAKTLVSGGGAARVTWQPDALDLRLDAGAASGESDGGFGVNDTNNFKLGGVPDGAARSTLHGFRFNRAFRVDGLLFRDLIGAVSNAGYLRPALGWHPLGRLKTDLRLEVALLAATAMSPDATPGKHAFLGWEPELTAHLRLGDGLDVLGRATLLVPGAALSNAAGLAADPAWRADAIVRWSF